jgi:probable F420-dependent oxidoreductase
VTVGLSAYDLPVADFVQLAVAADELGFDAIWLGEHVVLPVGYGSDHPSPGGATEQHHSGPIADLTTELLDPWVALSAAAARTRRIRLATGIYLLALRHPLLTAKAAATLHELSQGRLLLGVGAGWLQEEFDALGVLFADRFGRCEEAIEVLRRAWRGEPFEHRGAHISFGLVQSHPRPVAVPLVLGGNSDAALRRAAQHADAWFSSGTPSLEDAKTLSDRVRALRTDLGRRGPFRCYVRIAEPDRALVDRYRHAGLRDVVVWADQVWPPGDLSGKREALARAADALGLRCS